MQIFNYSLLNQNPKCNFQNDSSVLVFPQIVERTQRVVVYNPSQAHTNPRPGRAEALRGLLFFNGHHSRSKNRCPKHTIDGEGIDVCRGLFFLFASLELVSKWFPPKTTAHKNQHHIVFVLLAATNLSLRKHGISWVTRKILPVFDC